MNRPGLISWPKAVATALTLVLLPLSSTAQEIDDQVFKLENDPPPFSPFAIAASYLDVNPASIKNESGDLHFNQKEAAFVYTLPCSEIWGMIFGAGWVGVEVDMEDNPFFSEKDFNYVNMLLGGFTRSFPGWLWKFTLASYMDLSEFSFIDYALYQGVLWGKYDLCKSIELDFGFIAEWGLKRTKIWPIIGFIYAPTERWTINAVFPVDLSVNFAFTDCLSASAQLRFLRTRHRLKESEVDSQGIFEYRTTGAEFDLSYVPFPCLFLKGFIGSTCAGDFKVANRNDENATHFKFNSSLYAGVSALLGF